MDHFVTSFLHHFELPLRNPVLVFSVILFIILLAPIALKRLNIPGIIGLILSGVLIGPHGLHLLEKNSAVDLFSTIGLLYIMFIAGLELDLQMFRHHRFRSGLFGIFTFVFPLGLGYLVCRNLLGYEHDPSLLTASMFATHTLVAYPIVSKFGIAKHRVVAIAVGGTILTDTAVLIMLAVVMGHAHGESGLELWGRLALALGLFFAFMILVVPRVSEWFFRKLESEKHAHYIYVLSVVFFAAFLAEVAGVEPIIGAFAAGLALNKLIPPTSALMNRIEFIGNALFIPFFLISVGMLVDLRVIMQGSQAIMVALVLSVTALVAKWLAAFITQKSFRFETVERHLLFGLSSAHAAATLAVIMVGYQAGVLDDNILNGTIILVLVTCLVSSFATERAARKTATREQSTTQAVPLVPRVQDEHILVPVANPLNLSKLLEFALLIKDRQSVHPVSILSIVPNDETAEANIVRSRERLQEFVKQAAAMEVKADVITTIDHNPASGIARTSREIMADLIVVGWPQRHGLLDGLQKNLFVVQCMRPISSNKRLVIVTPPFAERESAFHTWAEKLIRLASELGASMQHFGMPKTGAALNQYAQKQGHTIVIASKDFMDWEDFLLLSNEIRTDDFLCVIMARPASLSYMPVLDQIPAKIQRYFAQNNRLLFYPQARGEVVRMGSYEDMNAKTLAVGWQALVQMGKRLR